MAKINLVDLKATIVKEVEISKDILVPIVHNQAMFDQVVAENNGKRQGTHSTLTKAEVRGGGRKPVPQKHTGNARQGSIRNPHYVGGGVSFGPKPNRNYKNKVNSKVATLAFKSAFTQKVNDKAFIGLVDKCDSKKLLTKDFAKLLKDLKINGVRTLLIVNDNETALANKVKNITKLVAKKWNQVSVGDLLKAKKIIIQETALTSIQKGVK